MQITLRNDFHETAVVVEVDELPATLTTNQSARIDRELCGHDGCACGGVRGPQFEGVTSGDADFDHKANLWVRKVILASGDMYYEIHRHPNTIRASDDIDD